jgi:hypothetical protein
MCISKALAMVSGGITSFHQYFPHTFRELLENNPLNA